MGAELGTLSIRAAKAAARRVAKASSARCGSTSSRNGDRPAAWRTGTAKGRACDVVQSWAHGTGTGTGRQHLLRGARCNQIADAHNPRKKAVEHSSGTH